LRLLLVSAFAERADESDCTDDRSGRSVLSLVCGDHHGHLLFRSSWSSTSRVRRRPTCMSQISLTLLPLPSMRSAKRKLSPNSWSRTDVAGKNIYIPMVLTLEYARCPSLFRSCRRPHRQLRYQPQPRRHPMPCRSPPILVHVTRG
jgi:hypothetical protein